MLTLMLRSSPSANSSAKLVSKTRVNARYGHLDALVDAVRRGHQGEPAPVVDELELADEVVGHVSRSDQLHHGKELLLAVIPFPLFQNQHEVVAEAREHRYPAERAGQVDALKVSHHEHNALTSEHPDELVRVDKVWHHLVETALPLTRPFWPRAQVYSQAPLCSG